MALITISDLEDYLGTTFDSATAAVYQSIIDAVSAYIECRTGQNFADDVYTERVRVVDGMVNLKNNVQNVYGGYYGVKDVIEVTGSGPDAFLEVRTKVDELLNLGAGAVVSSSLTLASPATLATLATALTGAGWANTVQTDVNTGFPALTLYEGNFKANPDDGNKIMLQAANEPMNLSPLRGQLYQAGVECSEGIVIYQGGYATIPADLVDATIRFVLKAYNTRTTAVSGDLKSEKVGDYQYTLFSGAEQDGLNSLSLNYYDVLGCYNNNFDI